MSLLSRPASVASFHSPDASSSALPRHSFSTLPLDGAASASSSAAAAAAPHTRGSLTTTDTARWRRRRSTAPDVDFDNDAGHSLWAPPSDRQLALRARLKSGWSVHTNRQCVKKAEKDKINYEEEEMILQVLKRAEELQQREKIRIGFLVERVENVKRNSQGNGVDECVLCAAAFGRFKAKPHKCHDCKSNACDVCADEFENLAKKRYWLCRICSETRTLWKSSGAWFYSDLPQFVMPTKKKSAARPSQFTARLSTLSQNSAGRPSSAAGDYAKNSPAAESSKDRRSWSMMSASAAESASRKSSGDSTDSNDDPVKMGQHKSSNPQRKISLSSLTNAEPEKPQIRIIRVRSRISSKSSDTDDDDDDDRQNGFGGDVSGGGGDDVSVGASSGFSSGISDINDGASTTSFDVGIVTDYSTLRAGAHPGVARDLKNDDDSQKRRSITDRTYQDQESYQDTAQSSPKLEKLGATASVSDSNFERRNSSRRRFKRSPYAARQQPIQEVDNSSLATVAPGSSDSRSRSRSPSVMASMAEEMDAKCRKQTNPEFGTIDFTLLYVEETQKLTIHVIRGKNLKPMDFNGLSDPYVKIHLLPGASRSTKTRTKTVYKTLNPEWKEKLTYHGIDDRDKECKVIRLAVLDEDRFGYEFTGETLVPLKSLTSGEEIKFSRILSSHLQEGPEDDSLRQPERGKIQLNLKYDTKKKTLFAGVVRCSQIIPSDVNGYADPYVSVNMEPAIVEKKSAPRKFKTSVKKKTLNPTFDQIFPFKELELSDLSKRSLEISVWDKDLALTDDYIGGVSIGIHSKGDRLQQWISVMRNPDQEFSAWHNLIPLVNQ